MALIENENQQINDLIIVIEHLKNALNSDIKHKKYNENNIQDAIKAISDCQKLLNCFIRERVLL